ncbi:hypothetical protein, partial [Sulfuriferula plumbiphila]|uniref:hypothetical protein n=1 Tax=Sulfuriferula plumbiphila TaxID=171865 RepID=UPI003530CEE6
RSEIGIFGNVYSPKEIHMHIEPGVVVGAKSALSYVTAAGAIGCAVDSRWTRSRKTGLLRFPFAAL